MLQDLKVNGVSAEKKMNDAIATMLGAKINSSRSFRYKDIKWLMLKQARSVLLALQKYNPNVKYSDLLRVFKQLGRQTTTDEVIAALEQLSLDLSISSTIETSINQVANASFDEIDETDHPADVPENDTQGNLVVSDTVEDTNPNDTETTTPESSITVNHAPTLSGIPSIQVSEGQAYSFTPIASDPDGDSLTFSATNLPGWANLDISTGTLSGTPSYSDAGTYSNINISASDGSLRATLNSFSITVLNTNRPPVIDGSAPTSITVGELYTFTPIVIDPDGDSLAFSVSQLPVWLDFNTINGTLSGTPTAHDVGPYVDLTITVSDGMVSTSLAAISITVEPTPVAKGSAKLTWDIPTTRTDGSSLTLSELDGFRIYVGDTPAELNMILDLNNGSTITHTLTELSLGTYFFAVTAYDTEGNESSFSNIVKKTLE
jgi:hypothetical protein